MTWLVAAAAVLVLGSAWFLAWPRTRSATGGDSARMQLIALRERLLNQLRELDVEGADRNMDAAVLADERVRLETELAGVLRQLESPAQAVAGTPAGSPRALWGLWVATACVLAVLAGGLYYLNNRETLEQIAGGAAQAGRPAVPPMVLEMVARLEKRLAEQPDDAQGWARIARAYAVLGRLDDARMAYQRAAQQAPQDRDIVENYAAFLVELSPEDPPAEAVALYQHLLKLDPRHPGALWVLGIDAYNAERYAEAVKFWEKLHGVLPPDSEAAPQVQDAIAAARERLKK